MMGQVAQRLARLCSQADGGQLRERAARYGAADALDRIIDAVRRGRHDAGLEADLDRLDDAFARDGIDGLTTGARRGGPAPRYQAWRGGGGGHPTVTAWVCPAPVSCPRAAPIDGPQPPVCALTGLPFTESRIHL